MDEIEAWVKASKHLPGTRAERRRTTYQDIDKIVKKAIDGVKDKEYNLSNGKPGQMQGLRKEV
jgi:hypothetical protein